MAGESSQGKEKDACTDAHPPETDEARQVGSSEEGIRDSDQGEAEGLSGALGNWWVSQVLWSGGPGAPPGDLSSGLLQKHCGFKDRAWLRAKGLSLQPNLTGPVQRATSEKIAKPAERHHPHQKNLWQNVL